MSPKGRYAIIFWKKLNKDKVNVREFDNEGDLMSFAKQTRSHGYATIVCELKYTSRAGEKTYKVWNFGAYPFFRNWYKYVGLFLIGMIICLILTWK